MEVWMGFGDYYGDGHGRSEIIQVSVRDKSDIFNAEECIKRKYGDHFFSGFANDYQDSHLSKEIWKALIENGYSVSQALQAGLDDYDYGFDECSSWEEVFNKIPMEELTVEIDLVIDAYIFLLNRFGAGIKVLPRPYVYLADAGYGCFDD